MRRRCPAACASRLRFAALGTWLVCWPAPTVAQQGAQPCRLRSLHLRFKSSPVDLVPAFVPDTFSYAATLDWAMEAFSVDAFAEKGCQTDNIPFKAVPVPAGQTQRVTIFAKAPNRTDKQPYAITVLRLEGSETELRSLRVVGASLDPEFNFNTGQLGYRVPRGYKVTMSVGHDFIRVGYVLLDAGQKVHISAAPQVVPADARRLQLSGSSDADGASAPQAETGEVQYHERFQVFPVDQGYERQVTISIESADPMHPRDGKYSLAVKRQGCNQSKPLYDPESRACVVNCGTGYYSNRETDRCSRCNTNCVICAGLLRCELCRHDTPHISYVVQTDGSCKAVPSTLLGKYYWWCVSFGIFVASLVCIGLALFCQCLCGSCCCPERDKYGFETDSEADFESERLLG